MYYLELPAGAGVAELAEPEIGVVASSEADEPFHEVLHHAFGSPSYVLSGDEEFAIVTALEVSLEKFKLGNDDFSSLTESGHHVVVQCQPTLG